MAILQEKLSQVLPQQLSGISSFVKEYGDKVVSEVNISQVYGGLRGGKGLVCDTSEVPPDKRLIIRGIELKDLTDKLPEEIYWLLLTSELPNVAN